jgi:hypothetical protein
VRVLSLKVGMLCAVSAQRVTGSLFPYEMINFEHYVRLLLTLFFNQLTEDEKTYGCFMHDYVHTANNSMNAKAEVIGE